MMGIDISNSLVVGASYEEIEDFIQQKTEESELDQYEVLQEYFDRVSPYYDADIESCFYGFSVKNYIEPTQEWFDTVKETAEKFEALTGVKARLRGGADVW